jgi:PadR family transcriptional regulator, regulatory protein PadR
VGSNVAGIAVDKEASAHIGNSVADRITAHSGPYTHPRCQELARHGYRIGPGTLYPLLHSLEQKGYLHSWEERNGRSRRRVFRATPKGRQALRAATRKISELFAEIVGAE